MCLLELIANIPLILCMYFIGNVNTFYIQGLYDLHLWNKIVMELK